MLLRAACAVCGSISKGVKSAEKNHILTAGTRVHCRGRIEFKKICGEVTSFGGKE